MYFIATLVSCAINAEFFSLQQLFYFVAYETASLLRSVEVIMLLSDSILNLTLVYIVIPVIIRSESPYQA